MSAKRAAQRIEKMADSGSLSARHIFRGIEYIVSMFVRDEVVVVEAEDRLTADQWRAEFDARCNV
jgi:coiled-coil domain-containing protein 61